MKNLNLNTLEQTVKKSKKRLGRGHGSGKVKTSGRGTKGQKARDSIRVGFEGGQLPLIKRLPLLRGKGRNFSQKEKAFPLSIEKLAIFDTGSVVDLKALQKQNLIPTGVSKVKILAGGYLEKKLTVKLTCSGSARSVIEKAGGSVS